MVSLLGVHHLLAGRSFLTKENVEEIVIPHISLASNWEDKGVVQ